MKRPRLVALDAVRGLSALAVCGGHLRAVMIEDFASVQVANPLIKLFYFCTSLGHQAVMVFFVLSGFFVGGSVWSQRRVFRPGRYAVTRLSRLWVVLVPALFWTALVDLLIEVLDPAVMAGVYRDSWGLGPSPDSYARDALTFLGNLAFLQTLWVPVYGSNGPLWSLANEASYYLLFPLLLCAMGGRRSERAPLRIVCLCIAAVVMYQVTPSIRRGFLVWLMGALVAISRERWRWTASNGWIRVLCVALGVGALLGSLVDSKLNLLWPRLGLHGELIVGLGASALCVGLLAAGDASPASASRSVWARASVGLSEISYTLYLFHFPVVILIGALVQSGQVRPPSVAILWQYAGWLLGLVLLSSALWWCFERRTYQVRDALLAHMT